MSNEEKELLTEALREWLQAGPLKVVLAEYRTPPVPPASIVEKLFSAARDSTLHDMFIVFAIAQAERSGVQVEKLLCHITDFAEAEWRDFLGLSKDNDDFSYGE